MGDEEDTKVQQQSPITVLSKHETYMFEEDKLPVIDATRVCTKKEFHIQDDEVALPKLNKLKFVES